MFVGHLAVALGAKAAEPRLPLGVAVAAAFALDLLWPVLLLAGVEVVRVHPHDTAFTNLEFVSYPWSHSLLTVLSWSLLAGLAGWRALVSRRSGLIVGALVASHWLLDVVVHRPDMPLWPGGPVYGLAVWQSVAGTLLLEGAMLAVGIVFYVRATAARDRIGTVAFLGLVALCTVLWATQPWAPLPPNATAVAWGALILWLLPPWSHWVEKHRGQR